MVCCLYLNSDLGLILLTFIQIKVRKFVLPKFGRKNYKKLFEEGELFYCVKNGKNVRKVFSA